VTTVIDANVLAALVLPLPYSEHAHRRMMQWKRDGEDLVSPTLVEYEIATVLRKAARGGLLAKSEAADAMRHFLSLRVQTIPPTVELHLSALRWAERLGHSKAYDAHYVALAAAMRSELWTADQRLVGSARAKGVDWVMWIGEGSDAGATLKD
jgi:predicted nucleic acid-binding protein